MSGTDGHDKSCRAGNCSLCQKGSWNRQYRTQARRRDRGEIELQVRTDLLHPDELYSEEKES